MCGSSTSREIKKTVQKYLISQHMGSRGCIPCKAGFLNPTVDGWMPPARRSEYLKSACVWLDAVTIQLSAFKRALATKFDWANAGRVIHFPKCNSASQNYDLTPCHSAFCSYQHEFQPMNWLFPCAFNVLHSRSAVQGLQEANTRYN